MAWGASFDCLKASTETERKICANPALSLLDEELASAYRAAARVSEDQETHRATQRAWISTVRDRCGDGLCLYEAYRNRINELSGKPRTSTQSEVKPTALEVEVSPATTVVNSMTPAPSTASARTPIVDQSRTDGTQKAKLGSGIWPSGDTLLKAGGACILIVIVLSIYLHKQKKLVIYCDYTDAFFTGLAPVIAIASYFALIHFDVPPDKSLYYSVGIFAALLLAILRSTVHYNNGFTIHFALAFITKVVIVGAFYLAVVATLVFFMQSTRKKGERKDRYEARLRREHKASMVQLAAFAAGTLALVSWLCERRSFSSLGEYFSPKSTTEAERALVGGAE